MRTWLLAALLAASLIMPVGPTDADTYVPGYTRKDGTPVAPHWRSDPNKSYNDNWSVKPNVNPHTGKQGTRPPTWNDRPPQPNPYGNPYGELQDGD